MFADSVKSLGDKTASFFETKEKTNSEKAAEKVDDAKETVQDQADKTSDSVRTARSDGGSKIGDFGNGVKDAAVAGSGLSKNFFFIVGSNN